MATTVELQFVTIVSIFWIVAVMAMLYVCVKRRCRYHASVEPSSHSSVPASKAKKTQGIKDGDLDISDTITTNTGSHSMTYKIVSGEEIIVIVDAP